MIKIILIKSNRKVYVFHEAYFEFLIIQEILKFYIFWFLLKLFFNFLNKIKDDFKFKILNITILNLK